MTSFGDYTKQTVGNNSSNDFSPVSKDLNRKSNRYSKVYKSQEVEKTEGTAKQYLKIKVIFQIP